MHDFQIGDIIRYEDKENGYVYGEIVDIHGDELQAEYTDDSWETFYISKEKAEYIEPVYIDEETACRFARYEMTAAELIGDVYPPQRIRMNEKHMLSADELLAALDKASKLPSDQFQKEWFYPIRYDLCNAFRYGHPDMIREGTDGYRFLPAEGYFVWNTMDEIDNLLYDDVSDFSKQIEELKFWRDQYSLPFEKREYPEWVKSHYIKAFDKDNKLDGATDAELALFKRYVAELCETNNKAALYAKAYGCYGGNRAFECDWAASRDALLKLLEIDDNPFLANTLGYIFYYGRCTGGEPEYEKAFKFFSVGAAGGVYESEYKLSDMFRHGYGVTKSEKIASNIIWQLYDENIKYIFDGDFDCKFADVALRAGNLFRDGVNCEADADSAYYYYLQAEFAIRMRMLEDDHYGDASVSAGIAKAIEEILPKTSYQKTRRTVRYISLENILRYRYRKHRRMELKIKQAKNGELLMKIRALPRGDEEYPPKLFITEPKAHFCGLIDGMTVKTKGFRKLYIGNRLFNGETATITFDSVECDELFLYGNKIAEFVSDEYAVVYPKTGNKDKVRFVSVVFNEGGRSYDYICGIPDVKVGDTVKVRTDEGETDVKVVRVFEKTASETSLPISKYKSIIGKC